MAFTKIAAAGIGSTETVTLHSLEVLNNATVGGVLTYEDVTNVDSIGIVTARAGVLVGSGITLSKDGDGFFTGVVTATSYSGDGSNLTGIDATQIITGNTSVQTVDTGSDGHVKVNTEGSERFRIDSSGNVNLGASADNTAIQASGPFSGATPKLEVKLGGVSNSYTRLINIANPSGATGSETLGRVGIKLALGNESNATETAKAGIIYAESTSAFNNGTSLCFATNNSERLRITSAGNVGIGSASPAAMLEVMKDGVPAIISNYDNQKHIRMSVGGSGGGFSQTTGNFFAFQHQPYADRGTDSNLTERLRIEEGGTLKVNENLSVTGIATVGSAVTISESGIEASGIGVTIASLNGGQIGMNRNMVKNGAMMISQRGTSAITWGQGNGYAIDTMRGRNNGGEFSMQQVIDAPAGTGLYYSLKCQVTQADTSVGASEYNTVVHIVEGYDFQRTAFGTSGAKDITLSFYVKCNATGTFTGSLVNTGNNRSFAFTYPISSANTWSRVIIKVPGSTDGSWNKGDGVGIKIVFALKIGSNFVTANPNTWASSELMGATAGNYNLMNSTSNYIYFTGIQLEEGTEATPFEHIHYSEVLSQCQRYFYRINDNKFRRINGYKRGDAQCSWEVTTPVPMRVAPSPTLNDGGTFTNFASNFNTTQSSPQISEWEVLQGHGLLVANSDWSTTYSSIPSWESYALDLSAEF